MGHVSLKRCKRVRRYINCPTLGQAANCDPPKSEPFNGLTLNLAHVTMSAGSAPMPNFVKLRPAGAYRQYGVTYHYSAI